MKDMTVHLTNVAIQKKNDQREDKELKWPLKDFRAYVRRNSGDEASKKLFDEIQMIIIKLIN